MYLDRLLVVCVLCYIGNNVGLSYNRYRVHEASIFKNHTKIKLLKYLTFIDLAMKMNYEYLMNIS